MYLKLDFLNIETNYNCQLILLAHETSYISIHSWTDSLRSVVIVTGFSPRFLSASIGRGDCLENLKSNIEFFILNYHHIDFAQ